MDLSVAYKLVANDQVVLITEAATLPIVDPFGLAEEIGLNLEESLRSVKLLTLKASGDIRWLEKILKLPAQSLKSNLSKFPLLQEIKHCIEEHKKASNTARTRAPTEWAALARIKIHSRNLFVQNRSNSVVLGLVGVIGSTAPQDEKEVLHWFLRELQQDIGSLSRGDVQKSFRCSEAPGPYEDQAQEVLENLRAHSGCSRANWCPSKVSFKIQKKNSKAWHLVRVPDLGKKKKTFVDSQEPFDKVLSLCIEYLSSSAPSSSSDPAVQEAQDEAKDGDLSENEHS